MAKFDFSKFQFLPAIRSLAMGLIITVVTNSAASREVELAKLKAVEDGRGIVLVSLTASGTESYAQASFSLFQPGSDQYKQYVGIGRPVFTVQENLSSGDGRWGRLVALSLEPGQWKFGDTTAQIMYGANGSMQILGDIQRNFTVEANKTIYLGNIDIVYRRSPSFQWGSLALALAGINMAFAPANSVVHNTNQPSV